MSKPPTYYPQPSQTFGVSDYEGDFGDYLKGPVKGSAAAPAPNPLEVNGAPAIETAHEYVIPDRKRREGCIG